MTDASYREKMIAEHRFFFNGIGRGGRKHINVHELSVKRAVDGILSMAYDIDAMYLVETGTKNTR